MSMNKPNSLSNSTFKVTGLLITFAEMLLLLLPIYIGKVQAEARSQIQHQSRFKPSGTSLKTTDASIEQLNNVYQLSKGLSDAGYYKHALQYANQVYKFSLSNNNLPTLTKIAIANNLAVVKTRLKRYVEARNLLKGMVAVIKTHERAFSPVLQRQLLILQTNLFELNLSAHEFGLAEKNLSAIYFIEKTVYSVNHPVLMHQQFKKISLEYEKGNYRDARKQLIAHWLQLPSGRIYNEARAEGRLLGAKINLSLGELPMAYNNLIRALKWQGVLDSDLTAEIYKQLSYVSLRLGAKPGRFDKALMYHHKHIDMIKRLYGDKHPRIAQSLLGFMKRSRILSEDDKALVIEIYEQSFGEDHPQTQEVTNQLSKKLPRNNQAAL